MPYRKISHDLKLAAVNLFEHNFLTVEQIVACVGFRVYLLAYYEVLAKDRRCCAAQY
jgi:hypothetical protein